MTEEVKRDPKMKRSDYVKFCNNCDDTSFVNLKTGKCCRCGNSYKKSGDE